MLHEKVATTVSYDDGFTRVVYHKTTVVKFNAEKIILDSGGWLTQTTKTRMNQASMEFNLGFHVYQENYEWFVYYKGKNLKFHDKMELYTSKNKAAYRDKENIKVITLW